MTDTATEAVERAIGDACDELHISQVRLAAKAVIEALAEEGKVIVDAEKAGPFYLLSEKTDG